MAGSFADLEVIANDDATLDEQPGVARERHIRADACGDHDHVAVQPRSIIEEQPVDARVAEHGRRPAPEMRRHAEPFHRRSQHLAGRFVELDFHEVPHQVHDVHVDVELSEAARGFEPKQATADDRSPARAGRILTDRSAIIERAEHEDAVAIRARIGDEAVERRHKRRAAGRNHQMVVGLGPAIRADDDAPGSIDARDAHASVEADVGLFIPGERIDEYVVGVVGTSQHA